MVNVLVKPQSAQQRPHRVDPKLAQAVLGPLNQKRVEEHWQPCERTDWGEEPGTRDCLGNIIDKSRAPLTLADVPLPDDVKAMLRFAMTDDEHIRSWFRANEVAAGINPFAATGTTIQTSDNDMVHTRGSVADKSEFHPAGSERKDVAHITSVGWNWNDAKGNHDGYALYFSEPGKKPLVFPEHEYRIVDALADAKKLLPEGKAVSVAVDWRVEHSEAAGIIQITNWESDTMADQTATQDTTRWIEDEKKARPFRVDAKRELIAVGVTLGKMNTALYKALGVEKLEDYQGTELEARAAVKAFCAQLKSAQEQAKQGKTEPKQDAPKDDKPKHWKFDTVTLKKFWVRVNKHFNKYQFSTVSEDREAFVHDQLEVEHLEDTPLGWEEAAKVVEDGLDAIYADKQPEQPAERDLDAETKAVWTVILPDVKAITNGMISDKAAAITYALDLLEAEQMMPLVKELGKDGVLKRWDEKKKYAHQPPQQKPAENKPQQPATASNGSKPTPPPAKQQTTQQPLSLPSASETSQSSLSLVPSNALATPELVNWEVNRQKAITFIRSGFLPDSIKTPEQAITIMAMGEAIGLQPIVALNTIDVIKGRPSVKPQMMLALVRRSGQLQDMSITDDGNTCTVKMTRKGQSEHVETFSMDDAKRLRAKEDGRDISLSEKYNWRQQPGTMRKWRAVAAACRVVFSDVIWGLYTPEELDPDITVDYIDAA